MPRPGPIVWAKAQTGRLIHAVSQVCARQTRAPRRGFWRNPPMKSLSQIALALGLPFTVLACGSESQIHTLPQTGTNPNATPQPESSDAAGQPFNDAVQPPRDYYNALFAQTLQLVDSG